LLLSLSRHSLLVLLLPLQALSAVHQLLLLLLHLLLLPFCRQLDVFICRHRQLLQ
jgi:hypothetical protein